jgi:DNA helicase II / ATP-dependent DNA helicase PcrA
LGTLQDCNPVQISLVALLQANRGQLTVVGDDAQSIYGFRGASNHAFEMLQLQIPDAVTNLTLVLNYRSVPAIISVRPLLPSYSLAQSPAQCTLLHG